MADVGLGASGLQQLLFRDQLPAVVNERRRTAKALAASVLGAARARNASSRLGGTHTNAAYWRRRRQACWPRQPGRNCSPAGGSNKNAGRTPPRPRQEHRSRACRGRRGLYLGDDRCFPGVIRGEPARDARRCGLRSRSRRSRAGTCGEPTLATVACWPSHRPRGTGRGHAAAQNHLCDVTLGTTTSGRLGTLGLYLSINAPYSGPGSPVGQDLPKRQSFGCGRRGRAFR